MTVNKTVLSLTGSAILVAGVGLGWLVNAWTAQTDSWGSDQWGAAGGWVGGIATFLAVVVALWQTNLARKHSDDARDDARELLATELDAQRRDVQANAVMQIMTNLTDFLVQTGEVVDALERAAGANSTEEDKSRLADTFRAWSALSNVANNAFMPANLLVSELETRTCASNTQKGFIAVRNITQTTFDMFTRSGVIPNNTREHVQDEINKCYAERLELLKATRRNISGVPALTVELESPTPPSSVSASPAPSTHAEP